MSLSAICSAIAYIEAHLDQSLDVNEIARQVYLSPMQLYRDFYSATGHSVKEYVRKRRLSNALNMLRFSDRPLAHIAYEWGYSSQQAFGRAVKQATGLTPLGYRNGNSHYYFAPAEPLAGLQIRVRTETLPGLIRGVYAQRRLAGLEQRAVARVLDGLEPGYRGPILGSSLGQEGPLFRYAVMVAAGEGREAALRRAGFRQLRSLLPQTLTLASVSVPDAQQRINEGWDYLCLDWLPGSMFEQDEHPYFEEYQHRDGEIRRLRLCLPVRRRGAYEAIRLANCPARCYLVAERAGYDAEKRAARAAVEYLARHAPHMLRRAQTYLVSHHEERCACGIRLEGPLPPPADPNLRLVQYGGPHALLEDLPSANGSGYERMLTRWAGENGLVAGPQPAYTLYYVAEGITRMSVRLPLHP